MAILLALYLSYQYSAVNPIVRFIFWCLWELMIKPLLKLVKDEARAWLLRKLRRVLYWRYLALRYQRLTTGLLA